MPDAPEPLSMLIGGLPIELGAVPLPANLAGTDEDQVMLRIECAVGALGFTITKDAAVGLGHALLGAVQRMEQSGLLVPTPKQVPVDLRDPLKYGGG